MIGIKKSDFSALSNNLVRWCRKNLTVLKGIGSVAIGFILILYTRGVILDLLVFVGGAALMYYGFYILRIKQITDTVDRVLAMTFTKKNNYNQKNEPNSHETR